MINLNEITVGDMVGLKDRHGNFVRGTVEAGKMIDAFGLKITFARLSRDRWVAIPGVRVVEHLPALFPDGSPKP